MTFIVPWLLPSCQVKTVNLDMVDHQTNVMDVDSMDAMNPNLPTCKEPTCGSHCLLRKFRPEKEHGHSLRGFTLRETLVDNVEYVIYST